MRKKFLLGVASLCLTTLASAGNVDPSVNPKDGTNVFATGQEGCIAVRGRILDSRPVPGAVKYVVYATKDDGVTKNDVLELSDFVTSMEEKRAGFVDKNPKVCVRRVVEGQIQELVDGEEVILGCRNKTVPTVVATEVKEGESMLWDAYRLLSREKLESAVERANSEIAEFGGEGKFELVRGMIVLKKNGEEMDYRDGKTMKFCNEGKGNISVVDGPGAKLESIMQPKYQKAVQTGIVKGGGKGMFDGDFELVVKVVS